ncbi:hypothetical protein NMY22_g2221 [Coprinellus aureogranulatus]|nr:hypothetical protein NMY22_g2221 [Coprinellus aureogranulatus]
MTGTGRDPSAEMNKIDDHDGFSESTIQLIRAPPSQWDLPLYCSKVEARVAVLERELRALRTCTNRTTLTCRLPPEILCKIFVELKPSPATYLKRSAFNWILWNEDLSWIRATHVCRHWRQVALNCKTLWSDLPLRHPEIAELFLRRARSSLLDIDYHGQSLKSERLLTEITEGGIHRLRSLRVSAHGPDFLRNLLSGSTGSAPFLKELSIFDENGRFDALPTGFLAGGAPSLTHLGLDGVSFNWETLPINPNLLHLHLTWRLGDSVSIPVKPSADKFAGIMQQLSSLRTLDLKNLLPNTASLTPTLLPFPALTSLRLFDAARNIQSFLEIAFMPNVSSITLSLSDNRVDSSTAVLLASLKASLTRRGEPSNCTLLVDEFEAYVLADGNLTSTVVLRCTNGVSGKSLGLVLEFHDLELTIPTLSSRMFGQLDFTPLRKIEMDCPSMGRDDWKATFGRLASLSSIRLYSKVSSLYSLLGVLSEDQPAEGGGTAETAWFPGLVTIVCDSFEFKPRTAGKALLTRLLARALGRRSDSLPPLRLRIVDCYNFDKTDARHIRHAVPKLKLVWDGRADYTQSIFEANADEDEDGD